MKRRRALVIVEGAVTEPEIVGIKGRNAGLLPFMGISDYEIVSFCNPIYELYNKYQQGMYDDLVAFLHSEGRLKLPSDKLSKTIFSAVYLVFDYEPHYHKYSDEVIRKMLELFNDETNLGKLYINYPMVEACVHLKSLPDLEYDGRVVDLNSDFSGDEYKKLVKKESCLKSGSLSRDDLGYILMQGYNKAKGLYTEDGSKYIDYGAVLERQISERVLRQRVFTLGTLPLMALDYNTKLALRKYGLKFDNSNRIVMDGR